MRRIALLLFAAAAVASVVAFTAFASREAGKEAAATFVTKIPSGYRDWRLAGEAYARMLSGNAQFRVVLTM